MTITKIERNKDLVKKRLKDPKKWSWNKLGDFYGIDKSMAKVVFTRDVNKYTNGNEIKKYEKKLSESIFNITKEKRNEELVNMRLKNETKWSWGELAKHFKIDRYTVRDIFYRDVDKYGKM